LKSLRTEGFEEEAGDEQAWDNWLVESDSDSSSDASDWINVDSDGPNNLEISDSDSEMAASEPVFAGSDQRGQPPVRVSSLATTKVRNAPNVPHETRADFSPRYSRRQILR
jgi:hypothetical protein